MRSEARMANGGWNSTARWCAPTVGGDASCRSTSSPKRCLESAADEATSSVALETGDEVGSINATAPNAPTDQGENCALLIEQLRAYVCRWPLWDSWVKLPPVDERYYCGARCSGAYCSEHATIASQLDRSSGASRRRAKR
jgi:hypothetical protein